MTELAYTLVLITGMGTIDHIDVQNKRVCDFNMNYISAARAKNTNADVARMYCIPKTESQPTTNPASTTNTSK